MSRVSAISLPSSIDYEAIAAAQENDPELRQLQSKSTSLSIKMVFLPNMNSELYCDVSTGHARPYVPRKYRENVFWNLHNLSHPRIKRTRKRFI